MKEFRALNIGRGMVCGPRRFTSRLTLPFRFHHMTILAVPAIPFSQAIPSSA